MKIKRYMLSIMVLVGLKQIALGEISLSKNVSDNVKASLVMATNMTGAVAELNLNDLDAYPELRLTMRYEQHNNDLFDGHCYLYSKNSGQLLASASNIKCFLYKTHLIIFLANQDGFVVQVKVITDFVEITKKNISPIQAQVYKASGKKMLIDIDLAKLNFKLQPMTIAQDRTNRLTCISTYSIKQYVELI